MLDTMDKLYLYTQLAVLGTVALTLAGLIYIWSTEGWQAIKDIWFFRWILKKIMSKRTRKKFNAEIKEQDRLLNLGQENTDILQDLFIKTINDFKRKGLVFEYQIYMYENKILVDITNQNGEVNSFKNCEPLINYLTELSKIENNK